MKPIRIDYYCDDIVIKIYFPFWHKIKRLFRKMRKRHEPVYTITFHEIDAITDNFLSKSDPLLSSYFKENQLLKHLKAMK